MKTSPWICVVTLLVLLAGASVCLASTDKADFKALSPRHFNTLLDRHQKDPHVVLLDIRTPKEFQHGHIEGAVLVDYYSNDFVKRLKTLDRQKTYLIYCRSGNRSGKSLAIFEKLGFRHAYHMDSGVIGWAKEGYPLVR